MEALRSVYYGGGLTLTADFIGECIETDCRPIPYDPQKVLVGRGAKKVDILHERFLKPLIPGGETRYGWTGWSPEIQVNVFLGLAEEARSKGGDPEPFRSWVREKVLPDLSEELRRQVEEYLIMKPLQHTIKAYIHKGEKYYVAECLDIGVVTQGETLDETIANLQDAVALYLKDEDPSEIGIAPDAAILAIIEVEVTGVPQAEAAIR